MKARDLVAVNWDGIQREVKAPVARAGILGDELNSLKHLKSTN